jgi:hypothetical protein
METEDGHMLDSATPYGMAVTLLNSLDRDGLMSNWWGMGDPILGPGTRISVGLTREIASARVQYLESDGWRARRRARNELRGAAYDTTRFLGDVCLRPEPPAQLLTQVAMSMKALADSLLVQEGLGSWPENDPFEFGLQCAKSAVEQAEEIDAWPLKAVAKSIIQMLAAAAQART